MVESVARKKKTRVFVSYSRHDEALVRPLSSLLGVASDEAVFLDVESLKPGAQWEKEIIAAVREASVFILCWCCAGKNSKFIAQEISTALKDKAKKVVPVLFCSTALPAKIADRQWIDLREQIIHACDPKHANDPAANPAYRPPRSSGGRTFRGERPAHIDDYMAGWRGDREERRNRECGPGADVARTRPGGMKPANPQHPYGQYSAVSAGGCVAGLTAGLMIIAIIALLGGLIALAVHLVRTGHAPALREAGYLAMGLTILIFALLRISRIIRERAEDLQLEASRISSRAESYFRGLGKTDF
jgi:hypothetical protein